MVPDLRLKNWIVDFIFTDYVAATLDYKSLTPSFI